MARFEAPPETRDFVIALLRGSAVADIDFHFGGLHVRNINGVGDLIAVGRIRVWIDEAMPQGRAKYIPADNKLWLSDRRVDNRITKVTIVHEAVHAYFDYRRTGGYRLEEEAACFVAERVFADNADIAYSAAGDPILMAAWRLVRRLNLSDTPGAHVTSSDYRDLLGALRRDSHYGPLRDDRVNNDGIPAS
jgi:hypothetical protein